ncbi:MAG: hypothetical protein LBP50_03975, partial [Tannerella sp.]|nr:hypothetical protein [Tannerella sp.]
MSRNDYLPANVLEFQNKVHNIRAQVTLNQTRWDISTAAMTQLDAPIAAFDAAVTVSENPLTRTSAAIRKRDEAREELEKVLRPFIQGHLVYNLNVTDDDLIGMDLPVHDRHPSPPDPPKDEPAFDLQPVSAGVLEGRFGGKNEKGHAKPKSVHGVEFCWLKSETPPTDWSELVHSEFATRSPLRLSFEGHDRGKRIY